MKLAKSSQHIGAGATLIAEPQRVDSICSLCQQKRLRATALFRTEPLAAGFFLLSTLRRVFFSNKKFAFANTVSFRHCKI
jgi:hypothetical protein